MLSQPAEPWRGPQRVLQGRAFIPAAQSGGWRGLPLHQLFILSSNLSLRCRSVYLLNLPHKQLNDGLSSPGNLWPPGNSKLK